MVRRLCYSVHRRNFAAMATALLKDGTYVAAARKLSTRVTHLVANQLDTRKVRVWLIIGNPGDGCGKYLWHDFFLALHVSD